MKKLIFVWIILLYNLISNAHISFTIDEIYFQRITYRLIQKESQGKIKAVSHKDAYGLYQITDVLLQDFKTFYGIRYRLKDMFDPIKSHNVYVWQMARLGKCSWATTNKNDLWVYKINSWLMGRANTLGGRFNNEYLTCIIPAEWNNYIKDKLFIKCKNNIWIYIKTVEFK